MAYKGNIYWDGKTPLIQSRDKFIEWLKTFPEDQWFEFTVAPIGSVNESNQRNLYFTWRDILADELGWTPAEMHKYLKDTYNGGRSTKGLTTKEWSQLMTHILAFAGENNITLPTGKED